MKKPRHSVEQTKGRPRLYGRAKGRPLRSNQQALMDELYPKIMIPEAPMSLVGDKELWLELGFGGGEHLIYQAQHNPDVSVWGAEPFLNGVAKVVSAVEEHGLDNIRVFQGDGRFVMDGIADETLSRLFVLFPDPWPKTRHNKRRLITEEFLENAHRIIKPGGKFRFASDIIDYVDWTLNRLTLHGGFQWTPKSHREWRVRPKDWPQTRYEEKAFREGRPCHYFEFVRT